MAQEHRDHRVNGRCERSGPEPHRSGAGPQSDVTGATGSPANFVHPVRAGSLALPEGANGAVVSGYTPDAAMSVTGLEQSDELTAYGLSLEGASAADLVKSLQPNPAHPLHKRQRT
jgi:hypothetical protein